MAQTESSLQKRGQTPIQVLEQTGVFTILAHVIGALPMDMPIMAKYKAGVGHAPKTYLKLAMGTSPVRMFRGHGIAVGLATDGAVSNNTLDILNRCG